MKDILKTLIINLVIVIVVIYGTIYVCHIKYRNDKQTTSPVESKQIDSLSIVNDSINKDINYLDSIKNDEIYKIKTLDNDSTLRMFYQLIGK